MFNMVELLRKDGKKAELIGSKELDQDVIDALKDENRREILELLKDEPDYPSNVSERMGIERQNAYYHFQKLEEAGLIEESHQEKRSGGTATYYTPGPESLYLDLGGEGEKVVLPETEENISRFLEPFVKDHELDGKIVVGSPDQHGPDQVRARDGHYAGEIGLKLGNYAISGETAVVTDTDVVRDSDFGENMLLLGGIMTNTVTKKFNDAFPVNFSGESFPYREIKTENGRYTEDSIGVIAKATNPENPKKALFLVAGIRNSGTKAAVRAFKNLEDVITDYEGGECYAVVRGLDMDGDGEIDSYEKIE